MSALEKLIELKTTYGLSFDVKALSVNINSEPIDIDDYECEFEDLSVMLDAWTAEQDCILAQVVSFFSGFSTAVPGANVKETELDIKTGLTTGYSRASDFISAKSAGVKGDSVSSSVSKVLTKTLLAKDVVTENLITTENTIGAEVFKAIEANKGGSVNDINCYSPAPL